MASGDQVAARWGGGRHRCPGGAGGAALGRRTAGHPGLAAGRDLTRAGNNSVPGTPRTRRSWCEAPLRFSLHKEAALM